MPLDLESKIRSSMNKHSYYEKFEINQIIEDAEKSVEFLESSIPSNYRHQEEIESFCEAVESEVYEIKFMNRNDLSVLYDLFKPDGDWNRLSKGLHENLRVKIFKRLNNWKEFYK